MINLKELKQKKRADNRKMRNTLGYNVNNKIICSRCVLQNEDITDVSKPILKSLAEKQECICTVCNRNLLNYKEPLNKEEMNPKKKRIVVLKQPFTMIEIPFDADPIAAKADWLAKHADVDKTLGKEQARREAMTIRAGKVEQRRRTK